MQSASGLPPQSLLASGCIAEGPHVELTVVDPVSAKDGADVRPVVVAVVEGLHGDDPQRQPESAVAERELTRCAPLDAPGCGDQVVAGAPGVALEPGHPRKPAPFVHRGAWAAEPVEVALLRREQVLPRGANRAVRSARPE